MSDQPAMPGVPGDDADGPGGTVETTVARQRTALLRSTVQQRFLSAGPELLVLLGIEVVTAPFVPVGILASLAIATWLAVRDVDGGAWHPGRRLAGLKVVDATTGRGPTVQQALMRNLPAVACWLLAVLPGVEVLGWIALLVLGAVDLSLILTDPFGRRIGDRLASTKVVPGTPEG